MNNANYTVLAGSIPKTAQPLPPFSPIAIDFLQLLSRRLLRSPLASRDQSWAALSFWLRPSRLKTMESLLPLASRRLGRGLVFHIAPSNMPAMFAYSFCISLLAGNGNIVRISPHLAAQTAPVFDIFRSLLDEPQFNRLKCQNALVAYDRNTETTAEFSAACDGRIIWGGNETIAEIRKIPLPPQAIELVFADRYSLSIFNSAHIAAMPDDELRHTAHLFYNDTYEADQNACSSPRFIFWLDSSGRTYEKDRQRWWNAVAAEASAYNLLPIKVSAKYTDAWTFAMTYPFIQSVQQFTNALYVYSLSALPDDITALSGTCGQFFQYSVRSICEILPLLSKKVQTISTIGIPAEPLRDAIISSGVMGADRIVPVGQALDMNVIWDGHHMLEALSRIIG